MMKHLKLVINNDSNGKIDIFFSKIELKLILNLYATNGFKWGMERLWIKYFAKREVSFDVYHRTSEFPVYKITKNLKPKSKNEKYIIKDASK